MPERPSTRNTNDAMITFRNLWKQVRSRAGATPILSGIEARRQARRLREHRPLGRGMPFAVGFLVLVLALPATTAPAAAQDAQPLTLERAIESALHRSPDLRQAEAERLRARAAVSDAFGRMLPSLYVSTGFSSRGTLTRTGIDPITGAPVLLADSLIHRTQSYGTSATLTAAWTLFDGGRRMMDAAAARQRSLAAEHEADARRVGLAAEVTLAYLDALEAAALVEVRAADVASAAALEQTAQVRFRLGEVPEIDVLQARLAASEAEIALLDAESQARMALLLLLERAGLPTEAELSLAPPQLSGAVKTEHIADDEELVRHALANSPVLEGLRARGSAARAEDRGPAWHLLPAVNVLAQWDWTEIGRTRDAFTLDPQNSQTYYRLMLSWTPLERPTSFASSHDRASAAELATEADLEARARALERELRGGLERLRRARALAERSAVTAELAERQRAQAKERYELGLAPMQERLIADALWAEAMRQSIVARYAPLRALAEMERASGTPLRPE